MVGLLGIQFGGALEAAFPVYQSLSQTRAKQFAAFERLPQTQRDVDYFRANAQKVETVEEFLADRRLMTVALSAYGMDDELQYMGRIRKVMTEPLSDKEALANKLIDPRFKALAGAFGFGTTGVANLAINKFIEDVIDKFKTNEFEKYLGERNPALREAEYFKRNIGSVTGAYNILGDKVLREVVTFTLGLPKEIALQSIEKQKALIDARVDIEDFQDPDFIDKFVRRFLILKDQADIEAGYGLSAAPGGYALGLLSGAQGFNFLV